MPSVSQIAKHANVSKSTVSLALNDKPGISSKMRQHVLSVAEELNSAEKLTYSVPQNHKNNGATPLTVMVLHPTILHSSHIFGEFLRGIEACASALNVQLRIAINAPDMAQNHATRLYLSQASLLPDGVLMIGARRQEPLIDEANAMGIPCVLMGWDYHGGESPINLIRRDEIAMAREATSYLVSLGHRAIAFLGGDMDYLFTTDRLAGYRAALAEHGIAAKAEWVALGGGKGAAEVMVGRIKSAEITAAVFVNEAYAKDGLPILRAAGCAIPDQLSVLCFDDTTFTKNYDPPLTTVRYHQFEEGYWMLKTLVEQIQQPLLKSTQITFHGTLVKRDSCKPPKESL